MSGGVDSSVAAALLVEQGYEVVGLMLRLWAEPGGKANRCCTPDAIADARRVAAPFVSQDYYNALSAVFSCPLYFDAEENALTFPRKALERRLVHTPDSLAEFLDGIVYHLIAAETAPASTSAAIKSLVSIDMARGMPSFTAVAESLHMSESRTPMAAYADLEVQDLSSKPVRVEIAPETPTISINESLQFHMYGYWDLPGGGENQQDLTFEPQTVWTSSDTKTVSISNG